jgi:hypothetical protein
MAAKVLGNIATEGNNFGASTTDKIGFYGLTAPIVQPSGSAQAAVATSTITTAATSTTPWGFATSTQADAVAAQVVLLRTLTNKLRTDLVALNLLAGA